jgi:hypothetical protein
VRPPECEASPFRHKRNVPNQPYPSKHDAAAVEVAGS